MFAQFNDPNGYGLYSVIGIAVGGYLCFIGPYVRHRVIGVMLLALGGFGYIVTVDRGTTLGILAGGLIVAIREITSRRGALVVTLWLIVVGLAGTTFLITGGVTQLKAATADDGSINEHLSSIVDLFVVSSSDVSVTGRMDAAKTGWQGIVDSPLVGVPLTFVWPNNVAPHQLMFYFAAVFGVPAGILVTMLLFTIGETRMGYANAELPTSERWLMHLSVIIGWTLLATAMTNNFAVPTLFWVCWAIACGPWLLRWQEIERLTISRVASSMTIKPERIRSSVYSSI